MRTKDSKNTPGASNAHPVLGMLVLGLMLVAAWLLWSGLYKPLLLALGAVSVVLTLAMVRRMGYLDSDTFAFHYSSGLPRFWAWLGGEIVKSSLEVARVVLRRDLTLDPKVVALDASDLDRFGQAILGNSITLTPGTLTLDVHEGRLLVHALTSEGAAALKQGEMQRRVKALRST